ncbi:MAG: hypothetical protein AAGD14_14610 [Planctomycetota bacterium]
MKIQAVLATLVLLPLSYLLAEEPEDVASKQRDLGKRLEKVEQTMERIAALLAKQSPEQAAKLRMAWQRSRSDQNTRVVQEIEHLIREGYFTEALEKQKDLGLALQRVLDILLDRDAEREEIKERIQELESIEKMIADLIKSETDQALESEKYADPERALQRAAAAKAKLSNLINRQNKLMERTGKEESDPKLDELRERVKKMREQQAKLRDQKDQSGKAQSEQAKLGEEAAKLAKDIAEMAKNMPEGMKDPRNGAMGRANPADQAGNAAERAAGAMKEAAARMQGAQPYSERQKDAEQELREAEEALRRLDERRREHEHEQLAKQQERIRRDAERLQEDLERLERSAPDQDAGSKEVGGSQAPMEKAEGQLSKGNRGGAQPQEQLAKEELEKAYKKLEKFEQDLKKLLKLPDYEKMAKRQDDTAENTDELLKKMEQAGKGQQPQSSEAGGEPTPGQGQVEGAKGAMQRASRNLRNKSSKRANSNQQEAVDRLKQAQEQVEEALRQLREEEQLMLLDAIERRLNKMLRAQMKIRTDTIALNLRLKDTAKANRKPTRADIDRARQLGEGESQIAVEAEKLLEVMREEGSTVVIPDVIDDMRKDLDALAERLVGLKAGEYTQAVQRDIIETLKELIDVIKEERERRQGGGGGGDQGDEMEGDQDENLLPNSAELKMLRSLQLRVNKRTNRFQKLRDKEDSERDRVASKQHGVAGLTRTMADKLNRAEDE